MADNNKLWNLAFQVILLGGSICAIAFRELNIGQALLLWVLGAVTISSFVQLLSAIQQDDLPRIESFWGGLDGGVGGWEFSKSISYFLLTLIFGLLFFLAGINMTTGSTKTGDKGTSEQPKKKTAAELAQEKAAAKKKAEEEKKRLEAEKKKKAADKKETPKKPGAAANEGEEEGNPNDDLPILEEEEGQ